MGIFSWFRQKQDVRPDASAYPMAEKQMMLWVARKIRKETNSGKNIMIATAALAAAGTSLRRQYGMDVIERNCPVERLLEAYSKGENLEWANATYDALIRDIIALDGNDDMTWLRLAYMYNPSSMEDVALELGFPKT